MYLNTNKQVWADHTFGKTYKEIIAVVCHSKRQIIYSAYKWSVTSSKHKGMIKRHYASMYPDYETIEIMPNGSMNSIAEKLSNEGM